MNSQFTHLVLSGGGMSGLVYLGTLRYLQQEGYDKNIKHIVGTSIGAFFATMFALDISMGELEERIKKFLNNKENCIIPCSLDTVFTVPNLLGIADSQILINMIDDIISKITFLELSKKTGKNLVITVTNVNTMQSTYFSVDTSPHVLISEAVRASMAIPLLFKPVEIGEEYYIDGGINDVIPINIFNNANVSPDAVLIVTLSRTIEKNNEDSTQLPSLIKYISSIFQATMSNFQSMYLIDKKYKYLHKINNCPVSFAPLVWKDNELILKISDQEIDESIALGYTEIQKFIHKKFPKVNF